MARIAVGDLGEVKACFLHAPTHEGSNPQIVGDGEIKARPIWGGAAAEGKPQNEKCCHPKGNYRQCADKKAAGGFAPLPPKDERGNHHPHKEAEGKVNEIGLKACVHTYYSNPQAVFLIPLSPTFRLPLVNGCHSDFEKNPILPAPLSP